MTRIGEIAYPRWYGIGKAETKDPSELKALVNTVGNLTASRYDSFDSPRGTSYVVPTGKTLYIVRLRGLHSVSAAYGVQVEVGYGDTHVENSAAAPTNAIAVANFWLANIAAHSLDFEVFLPVPAGKYPYVVFNGATWNIDAQGIEV